MVDGAYIDIECTITSRPRAERDPYRAGFIVRKAGHPDDAPTALDFGARIRGARVAGGVGVFVVPEGGVGDGAAAAGC